MMCFDSHFVFSFFRFSFQRNCLLWLTNYGMRKLSIVNFSNGCEAAIDRDDIARHEVISFSRLTKTG